MFQFTQEPSSGSYFVFSWNYNYDSIVLDIDHVINDEHNRIIIVVSAKHEIAPWWWFLCEPKHIGTIIGILIVFNIPVIVCISWNSKKVF